ncbi:MAG: hypothetical protein U1F76_22845 [Candidatus Competibacteraceae bacterium]
MWEIYSIGDSAFLSAILNGVAMIAGTGSLAKLASIGFLLAVFATAFEGLLTPGGAELPLSAGPGGDGGVSVAVRPHRPGGHRGRLHRRGAHRR